MGRTVKNREVSHPKPVQKVELSEKNIGLRLALVAILLLIGVSSIAYGVYSFLQVEPGWTEIHVDSSADTNVGNEFVFMYNLGAGEMSATAENKAIIPIYTEVMENAYQLFHTNQRFENVNNIYYINQHPNEEIVVDDMLYGALELVWEYGNRNIYMAPVYAQYDDIFDCDDDSQIVNYDPYSNADIEAAYKEILQFTNNKEHIDVQLLGDNKVKLSVSEEYLQYCEENSIAELIDFSWMKNAFIVDYLADILNDKGYTAGTISSFDGFVRNLDESTTEFSLNIFDKNQETVYHVATMHYSGSKSIVALRNYPINNLDEYRYYELENGEIRTLYLDVKDGLCKSATNNLYSYSDEEDCAEILLQIAPVYISEELQQDALMSLANEGIYSIYVEDEVVHYNEKALVLTGLYEADDLKYVSMFIE